MPTPLPDGYTPHGVGKVYGTVPVIHVRGPNARTVHVGRWGPTLCGQGTPPAYVRGDIHTVEEITCHPCRLLTRHAIAQTTRPQH